MNKKSSFVAFVVASASSLLSGCYQAYYDSQVTLSGVVQTVDGAPQRVDINDGISICLSVHLSNTVAYDGHSTDDIALCNVLTTASDGRFRVIFQVERPASSYEHFLAVGERKIVSVESARTYLQFKGSDNAKLVGEVTAFSKQAADRFSAAAKFVLNRSEYQPDSTIEVNETQKPYRK